MKQLVKPRLLPLMVWGVLILLALSCAQVLYFRNSGLFGGATPAAAPPSEGDSVEQALKHLTDLKASNWLQGIHRGPLAGQSEQAIAPAPDKTAATEVRGSAEAVAADPSLKGAVVVRSGRHPYLVMGSKRFRIGERIATGETIQAINLQTIRLLSPEGKRRAVEIGRGIGGEAEQTSW
jgi:hypothetical protein